MQILITFQFVSLFIVSLLAIYILVHKRKKLNFKKIWKFIIIIYFLKIFDILSTLFFVGKLGIEAEGNSIARFFMNYFGVIPGLVFHTIFIFPFIFLLSCAIMNMTQELEKEWIWKVFSWIFIFFAIVIPIYNLVFWKCYYIKVEISRNQKPKDL